MEQGAAITHVLMDTGQIKPLKCVIRVTPHARHVTVIQIIALAATMELIFSIFNVLMFVLMATTLMGETALRVRVNVCSVRGRNGIVLSVTPQLQHFISITGAIRTVLMVTTNQTKPNICAFNAIKVVLFVMVTRLHVQHATLTIFTMSSFVIWIALLRDTSVIL